MPELPEVESLRIGLQKVIIGQKIISIQINNTKIITKRSTLLDVFEWEKLQMQNQEIWQKELIGQIFESVERRAKNLIITMKTGDLLLVHLKMTGQLVFVPKNLKKQDNLVEKNVEKLENKLEIEKIKNTKIQNKIKEVEQVPEIISGGHPINNITLPNKHTHLIFELLNGTLFYNDIRKFGYIYFYQKGKISKNQFDRLGKEPLDSSFTLDYLQKSLAKNKGILKKVLLDQKIVVGLGNIYCDEVCFEARILPQRSCQSLTKTEITGLYKSILRIIPLAISQGGSSISNYLLVDGMRGNYADFHLVYGKYGKPCSVCGTILEKTKIGGRTTTFCPKCQS